MKQLIRVLAIVLISICSISAYALSTVTDVETAIASGNYDKAKTMLKEVLKKQPDSIVAHKYMLQVLDLEYAKTLQPSVEYKLYESSLATAVKKVADEKAKALEAERLAEVKLRNERTLTALCVALGLVGLGGVGFVGYSWNKKRQERQRIKDEEDKWWNEAYADVIDINLMISNMRKQVSDEPNTYDAKTRHLIVTIDSDNQDVQGCLDRRDYNKQMIIEHIRDAYDFFDQHGVKLHEA